MNENHNPKNEESSQEAKQIVSNLIGKIVDNNIPSNCSQSRATQSSDNSGNITQERVSQIREVIRKQPERKPTYEIYRAIGEFTESRSEINLDISQNAAKNVHNSPSPPSVPPSYSTVIKQGRPSLDIRRDVRSMETQHINPFSRVPPPSYAEIQGVWSREFSNASSEQILLGPDPIYIWCTHCATVVITVTQSQRSKFTHLTAAALCLFGCWPCAMLPYCMNSCKNIYHYCPDCNYLFGMYRPW